MNDNKKIAFNSVVLFLRLCIVSFIGIYASRVVLDALGASDYGLYNVVGGIVTLLNVFNNAMMSTTYRYLAFEIGKKEKGEPNRLFNICFYIHFAFAVLILILGGTLGEWYIANYLNVDPAKLSDAYFVFRISLATTVVSTLMVPFNGLLVAYERFSVSAIIDIVAGLIRLTILLMFIYSDGNRIRLYTFIQLGYVVIKGLFFILYSYSKLYKVVQFKIYKNVAFAKEMMSYALWTVYGACAYTFKGQGANMILNLFFGTVINAAFAVANQVNSFVLMFSRNLNSAAIPQITKNYSSGNQTRSLNLASYISKYTFILMTLVAFPIMLEMDFLLNLWLKETPAGATVFCKLMVLGALIECLGEGISPLVQATGKIKTYSFTIHTVMLAGIPIGYICYKFGAPFYTISIVFCLVSLISSLLKVILLKKLLHIEIKKFFMISYVRIFIISVPLIIFYMFYNSQNFTVIQHIIGLIFSELFLIAVILLFGIDRKERGMMKDFIKGIKLKINSKA